MECKCVTCIKKDCPERTEPDDFDLIVGCDDYLDHEPTNADRIRAMSDEELACHLFEIGWDCHLCKEHSRLDNEPLLRGEKCDEDCVYHCLEWLKQPAEVDHE